MSLLNQILQHIGSHIVVDYGTSGIWQYKKYADGSCEAWGKYGTNSNITYAKYADVNGLCYATISNISYPFTIYGAIPVVKQISASVNVAWEANVSSTSEGVSWCIIKNGYAATLAGASAYIHVKGRWK